MDRSYFLDHNKMVAGVVSRWVTSEYMALVRHGLPTGAELDGKPTWDPDRVRYTSAVTPVVGFAERVAKCVPPEQQYMRERTPFVVAYTGNTWYLAAVGADVLESVFSSFFRRPDGQAAGVKFVGEYGSRAYDTSSVAWAWEEDVLANAGKPQASTVEGYPSYVLWSYGGEDVSGVYYMNIINKNARRLWWELKERMVAGTAETLHMTFTGLASMLLTSVTQIFPRGIGFDWMPIARKDGPTEEQWKELDGLVRLVRGVAVVSAEDETLFEFQRAWMRVGLVANYKNFDAGNFRVWRLHNNNLFWMVWDCNQFWVAQTWHNGKIARDASDSIDIRWGPRDDDRRPDSDGWRG